MPWASCRSLTLMPDTAVTLPCLLRYKVAGVWMVSPFLQLFVGRVLKSGDLTTLGGVMADDLDGLAGLEVVQPAITSMIVAIKAIL